MVIYGFYSVDCGKFIPSIVGKLFRGLWVLLEILLMLCCSFGNVWR